MGKVKCPGCNGSGRANGDGGPLDLPCGLCLRTGTVDEEDLERFKKMCGVKDSEQMELAI